MDGYAEFREAARQGIASVGAEPVLVEDQPSRPVTPRNACLDLVAASDALVCIVGPRGGYESPSGKLVVEEEFDEARRRGIPILVFVQRVEKDEPASSLASRFSHYVGGRYRREFSEATELERLVVESLEPLMATLRKRERNPEDVQEKLGLSDRDSRDGCRLCLVVGPFVEDVVVDPMRLEEDAFQESVLRVVHETKFFSYRCGGKDPRLRVDGLVIAEVSDVGGGEAASLELDCSGLLRLERPILGERNPATFGDTSLSYLFEIPVGDLDRALAVEMAAASALLDLIDPYERYGTLLYNVALAGIGQRNIVDAPTRSNSYSGRFHDMGSLVAYDAPRRIARPALRETQSEEARRIISLLRRRIEAADSYL